MRNRGSRTDKESFHYVFTEPLDLLLIAVDDALRDMQSDGKVNDDTCS